MWMVINRTPYAAEHSWIQDKNANKIWIVVVKATFDVQSDGSTRLSDEQIPVLRTGQPSGEFGDSSLIYEADLLGLKPVTDILVNGNAWAPDGKPAPSIDVRLTIGPIKKQLRVFGDRFWEKGIMRGLTITDAKSFESMPIKFERAYGGWDRSSSDSVEHRFEGRNPVGTGFALHAKNCIGMRLPNVEYPDQLIHSWKARPIPAGLNAIDCSWSPRRELAGTYDEQWRQNRFPLWAEDFDPHYNNCAPRDQQTQSYLRGGEAVELINLSPNGRLGFSLPRIYPFFETYFGHERVEHRAQLCTVIIEPDVSHVIMAWQTSLVCNHRVDELDMTVVTEKRLI